MSRHAAAGSLTHTVAVLLIISFIIPHAAIFAQETTLPSEAPASEQTSEPAASTEEITSSSEASEGEAGTPIDDGEGGGQSLLDSEETYDPPTISNPNLFSAQSKPPEVDQSTGALIHRVALDVPPGRSGLTPELALVYNSQQLEDGIVGYGWSLSIPYIERMNKAGVERLYLDNYFTSSLGGELATTSSGEYQHRFENGDFLKYTYANNSWIAYDKQGTKYTFGATTTAQLYATTSPSNVYRWMLEEVRDTNDNYITYAYVRDNNTNQIYPSQISYTGNGTTDGPFAITFTRETRTDPIVSYKTGFRVRTTDRISEVRALVNGQWVRKYDLDYTTGQNTARSLLASVQLTGRDENESELTLPATTFMYSSTTPGYEAHTNKRTWSATRTVADVDGNGLPDLNLFYLNTTNSNVYRSIDQNLYPSFSNGVTSAPEYWAHDNFAGPGSYSYVDRGSRLLDVTGDGKADLLRSVNAYAGSRTRSFYTNQSSVQGFSWVALSATSTDIPMFSYEDHNNNYNATGLFGNVNGDGLVDFVVSVAGNETPGNGDADGTYLHVSTSSPQWSRASSTWTPVGEMPASGSSQTAHELLDINGDGLDDWMQAGAGDIKFCLNTGASWFVGDECLNAWRVATSSRHANGWDRGIRFVDLNGDGLPDYVRGYNAPTYSSNSAPHIEIGDYDYVYLNTGSGWATTTWHLPNQITGTEYVSGKWTGRIVYNELVDWNGDGLLDGHENTSTTTRPDLLAKITYPTKGSSEFEYLFSSQLASQNPELAFPALLVTSVTNRDNLGGVETTTYSYEGGKMYTVGDVRDRRFAGFATTTKRDALGVTQTLYHQGDTAASTTGERTDHFALIGKPYREDVNTLASTTLSRAFYHHSVEQLGATATSSSNTHSLDLEVSSNQYAGITDGSQTGLDFSDALTLSAWVKFETLQSTDDDVLIAKRNATGANRSYTFYSSGSGSENLTLTWWQNGSTQNDTESVSWSPTTGTWYHVAVTKSGTSVKFYVNGSQQGSTQTGTYTGVYNSAADFRLGADQDDAADDFDGKIDDVRVWSRELSSTEIGNLYASPDTFANGSSLQGSWQLNNAYTDASGNGNTLTGVNSPVFSADAPVSTIATSTSGAYFISLARELAQSFEGGSSHKAHATEYTYATSTGNLLSQIDRGEVIGSPDGTYVDTGSDARFTALTYATTTARNQSLLSSRTLKNNASTTVAVTNLYYDDQPFGSTTKGNITKEENWIAGLTYASSTKSYTSFGLVATSSDPRGNKTAYQYDAYNIYAATTTNALGHVTGALYDLATGKPKRIVEPNGLVKAITFDPVGRPTEEKQSDIAAPSSLVTARTYAYTDTFPASVQTRAYLTSATTTDQYRYLDGLGRTLQERTQAGGNNTYAVRDFGYNAGGLLLRESLPYFASSSARTSASGSTHLFTTHGYDALRRPTSTNTNVGSTLFSYVPWQVTTTDMNGNPKTLMYDAYQNLTNVLEFVDGETGTTTYGYDVLNNLTSLTDALGNVRTFGYDGLSRRTMAQDLHDSADTMFGIWNYEYDFSGNLASSTDPKSQVVNYSYDALNRVTSENYLGGTGTEVSYLYDFCSYGTGRMCAASSTETYTSTAYNVLGLTSAEARRINGTGYASTTYSYDRQGNPTTITYPDGREVVYGYDAGGRISDIRTRQSAGVFSDILSRAEYAPHGLPSLRRFGNTIETPYEYDETEILRLSRVGAPGSIQNISYLYDPVGNILTLSDYSSSTAAKIVVFEYDDLHRLLLASTTAASSTPFREQYTYSMLGNILSKAAGTAAGSGAPNTHSLDLEVSSNQYAGITDGSQTGLDFSDAFTLSTWVKFESLQSTDDDILIAKRNATGANRSYSFYSTGSGSENLALTWWQNGSSENDTESVSWSPSTGTWYHVAVTKSGTSVKFYVNGAQQGSTQTGTYSGVYNSVADFRVGADQDDTADDFDGLLDDVRVWSRELSSTELANLYSSPSTFDNGSSLQGSWRFDNAYTDGSGNGNTLTGVNSPVFASDVAYTSSSGSGANTYAYDEIGFANPHAPTSLGNGLSTSTLSYDVNGNLTHYGTTTYHTWDYRNRLTALGRSGATSTYGYDHTVQRTRQSTASSTTHYINKFYAIEYAPNSTTTATTTSYIWQGDTLVAYVETPIVSGITGAPMTYFVHPDHLGSTNVVTNASGTVVQTLDYYPYGAQRISEGSTSADRQYIGEPYDVTSRLNYLNARYYEGRRGQFLSQDPTHLAVGNLGAIRVLTGKDQQMYLTDPQLLNSYSYGRNNPITLKDPQGTFPWLAVGAVAAYAYFTSPTFLDQGAMNPNPAMQAQSNWGQAGFFAASLVGPGGLTNVGGKANVVFDGVWSLGNKATRAENAVDHAARHAADFGLSNTSDYIKAARGFVGDAINGKYPIKIGGDGMSRAYDSVTNTFSAFRYNPNTGGTVISTFFKPTSGSSYFGGQSGRVVQGLQSLVKGLQGLVDKLKKGQ